MKYNKREYPSFLQRIASVWYRHFRVYTKNLITNGFPPFLEPLIFLAGIGIGLGNFVGINKMEGLGFLEFLASGLMVSTAMMTSAFECSYGTFIRLEFDRVYDGMLAAPLSVKNIFIGEILWAGSKGFFFSLAVLIVVRIFGVINTSGSFAAPLIGFLTGLMFSSLSLFITSFVKSIDQFNFYFSGFLSPMFFFSGIVFPVSSLPVPIRIVSEFLPLTHSVRLTRSLCFGKYGWINLLDISFIALFIFIFSLSGIRRLTKKIID